MAKYKNYPRNRPGRREEPSGDAISVALTAQIIICAALLLFGVAARRFDENSYAQFREQIDIMISDTYQGQRLYGAVENWTSQHEGFFASIERIVADLIFSISGGRIAVEDSRPSPDQIYEPKEMPLTDAAPGSNQDMLRYDYLNPIFTAPAEMEIVQASLRWEEVLGMGRSSPGMGGGGIYPSVEAGGFLPVPEGASIAPVMLGGRMRPPVTGIITSPFAYRVHPVSETVNFHTGIDIAAEEGRPILAALPGVVVEVGWSDIYGNYIILEHAGNLRTFYGHCSVIIAKEGMVVSQGERIAKVGNTGMSTGSHLHFSVIVDGVYTDPLWVLGDFVRVVD